MVGGTVIYFREFLVHSLLGSLKHSDRDAEDTDSHVSEGEDMPGER